MSDLQSIQVTSASPAAVNLRADRRKRNEEAGDRRIFAEMVAFAITQRDARIARQFGREVRGADHATTTKLIQRLIRNTDIALLRMPQCVFV